MHTKPGQTWSNTGQTWSNTSRLVKHCQDWSRHDWSRHDWSDWPRHDWSDWSKSGQTGQSQAQTGQSQAKTGQSQAKTGPDTTKTGPDTAKTRQDQLRHVRTSMTSTDSVNRPVLPRNLILAINLIIYTFSRLAHQMTGKESPCHI